jgi:hypothetical protein
MIVTLTLDFDFTPERLNGSDIYSYSGGKNLSAVKSLEAVVDTRDNTLCSLGDLVPNLEKLRLNNSKIPNVRDIGCQYSRLRVLWLARCGLTSLNGVSTLSRNLEELYVAHNHISDVSDVMGMEKLKILDLAENAIDDLVNIQFLTYCNALQALTLVGNPCVSGLPDYVETIAGLVPQLTYLDEKRIRGHFRVTSGIHPNQALPAFDRRLSPLGPHDGEAKPFITDLLGDKINNRPPSACENSRPVIRTKDKPQAPEFVSKLISPPKIIRPLSSLKKIKMP